MEHYRPNPVCRCMRCRARGIMGPSILIVLGVMLLLDNLAPEIGRQVNFHHTWPLLLIVIGLVKIFQSNAPTDDHVQPDVVTQIAAPPPPPPPPSPEVNHV